MRRAYTGGEGGGGGGPGGSRIKTPKRTTSGSRFDAREVVVGFALKH